MNSQEHFNSIYQCFPNISVMMPFSAMGWMIRCDLTSSKTVTAVPSHDHAGTREERFFSSLPGVGLASWKVQGTRGPLSRPPHTLEMLQIVIGQKTETGRKSKTKLSFIRYGEVCRGVYRLPQRLTQPLESLKKPFSLAPA